MATKALEAHLVPTVENIMTVYRSASAEQIADGMAWYGEAHSLALALAGKDADGAAILRAAGVISAYSPMMPWNRNMALAVQTYADGVAATGAPGVSVRKAQAILDGGDVFAILKAPKTSAFAASIADPAHATHVVIDRHAMSVAIGRCSTDEDTAALGRKGVYERYADCYREAARLAGVSPAQMQAITWVVWRETKIRTAAAMRREAGRGE